MRWLAAAAAAAVLIGIGLWVRGLGSGPDAAPSPPTELATAAAALARAHPGEFGDFRPFAAGELQPASPEPLRGDELSASPSGRILDPRPTFRWNVVPGARAYVVTLLGPEGVRWKRSTSATALAWPEDVPPLEPGARVVWTLSADDPHATQAERVLRVLSADEAQRWRAAVAAAESVGAPLRWLLLAQAALRRDLPGEAVDYAERYLAGRPTNALGTATLAAARARLTAR